MRLFGKLIVGVTVASGSALADETLYTKPDSSVAFCSGVMFVNSAEPGPPICLKKLPEAFKQFDQGSVKDGVLFVRDEIDSKVKAAVDPLKAEVTQLKTNLTTVSTANDALTKRIEELEQLVKAASEARSAPSVTPSSGRR